MSLLMSISAKGHCQGPSCSGQKLRSHLQFTFLSSSLLQPSTQAQQSTVRVTSICIAATTYKLVSLQCWPLFKPPEAVLGSSLSRADRTVLGTCSQLSQSQVHQGWGFYPCTALLPGGHGTHRANICFMCEYKALLRGFPLASHVMFTSVLEKKET